MTPLERAVIETMAAHNGPQREEDAPYPWSLLPMARAVIKIVTDEALQDAADMLDGRAPGWPEFSRAARLVRDLRFLSGRQSNA